MRPYLERAIEKGIPSLFSDVKNLYTDPSKLQTIQDVVEDIRARASPNDQTPPSSTSPDPTDYLWTLYFLAQHYSTLGQHDTSLAILHTAMEHTPTLPELYMTKARVLKRAGDPYGAVRAMDDARKLDGQDRYVNTKSGKYRLRAGMISEADEVLALFTKVDLLLVRVHGPLATPLTVCSEKRPSWPRPARDASTALSHRSGRCTETAGQIPPGAQDVLLYPKGTGFVVRCASAVLERVSSCSKISVRSNTTSICTRSARACLVPTLRASMPIPAKRRRGLTLCSMLAWEDDLHSHPAYVHSAVWSARVTPLFYLSILH